VAGLIRGMGFLPARVVIILLKGYHHWISPYMLPACRFYPTCSVYAVEVIGSHGLVKGGYLALKRLLKCHPFHPGGVDYPPEPASRKERPQP